jgi:hypothetical protein
MTADSSQSDTTKNLSDRSITKPQRQLRELGVTQGQQVTDLFSELRSQFDSEVDKDFLEVRWKEFRDTWVGRKTGVLSRITDNWLKPAPAELKRIVGQDLNQLRAHV